MTPLVAYLLLFLAVGIGFIFVHLVAGKLIRPAKPNAEKQTVYECGEPTIGSAWVQFDLRFYVVALLFVIFDVELAFFFPWAVVFGTANRRADPTIPSTQRAEIEQRFQLPDVPKRAIDPFEHVVDGGTHPAQPTPRTTQNAAAAKDLAWIAFADILVFFGVL